MEQLSFFTRPQPAATNALDVVPGLVYMPSFVRDHEQSLLVEKIDEAPWMTVLKRRVQHYGYRYDYKARRIDRSMRIGRLPVWVADIGNRLVERKIFDRAPDQAIVNEYEAGQGIARHIDCEPCFGGTVASLSLLSAVAMDFENASSGEVRSLRLEPGSLIVLQEEARYGWKHGISARLSDPPGIRRGRRISITFRTVVLEEDTRGIERLG